MSEHDERRRFLRIDFDAPTELRQGLKRWPVKLLDLSLKGLLIERPEPWDADLTQDFDAIILDLGLPVLDGLTILKRWRKAGRTTPVLVLTARGHWEERVEGIEAGADDYVTKPFRVEEVVARIRAIVRRSGGFASSRLEIDDLVLDTRTMQVTRDGVPISLTPQEYKLLAYLLSQREKTAAK